MKLRILMILFISTLLLLFISSCREGTERNYRIVNTIMSCPDSLHVILKDTSLTSSLFKYRNDIKFSEIERIKNYINDFFPNGFLVIRDEISRLNYHFVFKYYIHEIVLSSKTNKDKKILFSFVDENNIKDWRIEEIGFFDPIIDGTPQYRIPG